MQLKIYKRLNILLIVMLVPVLLFVMFIALNFNRFASHLIPLFVAVFLYNIVCFFLYKTLEKNWDKRLIQKMAIANQVVIATIKKATLALAVKESSGKKYNLWEMTVDMIDHDFITHPLVFYEKMNLDVEHIPQGTVFLTHDPAHPDRRFIIPNVIISQIKSLIPVVNAYEQQRSVPIKYLNVYYNEGLIIETYRESMKKQKDANSEV